MKWGLIVAVVLVAGAAAVMAMSDVFVRGSWRYKMTVVVETPKGIRTGSAVREVRAHREPDILPDVAAGKAYAVGEAVAVDLGGRGVLFALLGQDDAYRIVFEAFPYKSGGLTAEGIRYYRDLKDRKAVLEPGNYPTLVTFTDMDDPRSVTLALRSQGCGVGISEEAKEKCRIHAGGYISEDNLEKLFGEGVSLKEITIEMTDEPVTWGIVDRYLPESFQGIIIDGWRQLSLQERERLVSLTTFKKGEPK